MYQSISERTEQLRLVSSPAHLPPPKLSHSPSSSSTTSSESSHPANTNNSQSKWKVLAASVGSGLWSLTKSAAKKTVELNQKYHITENIKSAAISTVNTLQKKNEEYHVTESIHGAMVKGFKSAKDMNEKYHITENIATGAVKTMQYAQKGISTVASGVSEIVSSMKEADTPRAAT